MECTWNRECIGRGLGGCGALALPQYFAIILQYDVIRDIIITRNNHLNKFLPAHSLAPLLKQLNTIQTINLKQKLLAMRLKVNIRSAQ